MAAAEHLTWQHSRQHITGLVILTAQSDLQHYRKAHTLPLHTKPTQQAGSPSLPPLTKHRHHKQQPTAAQGAGTVFALQS
jgi:hypothetical protein